MRSHCGIDVHFPANSGVKHFPCVYGVCAFFKEVSVQIIPAVYLDGNNYKNKNGLVAK